MHGGNPDFADFGVRFMSFEQFLTVLEKVVHGDTYMQALVA